MRPIYEIKADINAAKTRRDELEKEIPAIRYQSESKDVGKGVKALIFSVIAAASLFFYIGLFWLISGHLGIKIASFIIPLIFFFVAVKSAVRYAAGKVSTAAAGTFLFFSLLFLAAGVYTFIIGCTPTPTGQIVVYYQQLRWAAPALVIPPLIMMIGSIVTLIRETVKKSKVARSAKEKTEELEFMKDKIVALEKELKDTKREAQTQSGEETQTPDPDGVEITE